MELPSQRSGDDHCAGLGGFYCLEYESRCWAHADIGDAQVIDVAEALRVIMDAETTTGATFSLPGPETFTYDELFSLVEGLTYRKLKNGIHYPKIVLTSAARVWENIWWPTISPDEITRRFINELPPQAGTLGFDYLGIEPHYVRDVAIAFLRHYRPRRVPFSRRRSSAAADVRLTQHLLLGAYAFVWPPPQAESVQGRSLIARGNA